MFVPSNACETQWNQQEDEYTYLSPTYGTDCFAPPNGGSNDRKLITITHALPVGAGIYERKPPLLDYPSSPDSWHERKPFDSKCWQERKPLDYLPSPDAFYSYDFSLPQPHFISPPPIHTVPTRNVRSPASAIRCKKSRDPAPRKTRTASWAVPEIEDSANPVPNSRLPFWILTGLAINNLPGKKAPVKDIYNFIERNFPYHRNLKVNWKNSVRHCLSYSRFFRKFPEGGQASNNAFCQWELEPRMVNAFWDQLEIATRKFSSPAELGLVRPDEWLLYTGGRARFPASTASMNPVVERLRAKQRPAALCVPKEEFSPCMKLSPSSPDYTFHPYKSVSVASPNSGMKQHNQELQSTSPLPLVPFSPFHSGYQHVPQYSSFSFDPVWLPAYPEYTPIPF